MRNWSSWHGCGSHLIWCTSYAAALVRFPLVAGTWIHRDHYRRMLFCSFLGLLHLFMHKMCKSETQLTCCSLQHFYSWNSTTTWSSCYSDRKNYNPQIHSTKEGSSQNISWGLQIISIILISWTQLRLILSNHSFWPDYQAQQSLICHFSHFACPPSYEGYTSPDTTFIKERILCKIICHPKTKSKKYVCRSCLLHFNSLDLNSKHLRLSAQKFFSLVSLCSCIRIQKKLVLSLS